MKARFTPPAVPPDAIWVRFPRFIGDGIMIHRAVESIDAKGAPFVAWGPASLMELLEGHPRYAATVPDPPAKLGPLGMARLLRACHAKALINLPRSQRASLAAWLARVPLRLGWSEGLGCLVNSRSLPYKELQTHQQERYLALIRHEFPESAPAGQPFFAPRAESQEQADRLLAGVPAPRIVFALGSMSWSKRLATEVWLELGRLVHARGWSILLLGFSPDDRSQAARIAGELEAHDFTGRTSLSVGAGLLRRSIGAFGNDSALSHLSAACGLPTVVAFGPTQPGVTAPLGNQVRVVRREELDCLECMQGACPLEGHPCMRRLAAQDLLLELDGMLAKEP